MKFLHLSGTEKYKTEICVVNLIILLYLSRTAIPLFKFPFLLLFLGFIAYSIIHYKARILSTLKEFVRNYYLLLLLSLILVISIPLSNKLYLMVFKDVVNMLILLSVFFMLTIVVSGKKEFTFYVSNLVYLIVLFAFIISVFVLLDLLDILSYNDFSEIDKVARSSSEEAISIDYNFALVPVLFGVIGVFYLLPKTTSKLQKVYYNFFLIVFTLNIILSGSRRGFIIFLVIFLILATVKLVVIFNKKKLLKALSSNTGFFLLSVIVLPILLSLFFLNTSFSFKTKTLKALGTKNVLIAKTKISLSIFRYAKAFDKSITYTEVNQKIWTIGFDSKDPDSGWGNRIHKTIFPLTGENVEIVPKGVKGYFMDKTCNASYYAEDNLSESYTQVADLIIKRGDRYKASVFCYVSDDFDGSTVSFGNMFSYIEKGVVTGNTNTYYDLTNKGKWKKLEIEYSCFDGETSHVLSFTKKGARDFSNLKGFVIFAYPRYEKIDSLYFDPKNPDSGWGNRIHKTIFPLTGENVEIVPDSVKGYYMDKTCNASYYSENDLSESYTRIADLTVRKGDHYKASIYCYVSENFDGSTVSFGNVFSSIVEKTVMGKTSAHYHLERKGRWEKLEVEYDCKDGTTSLVLSFTKKGVRDFSKLTGYVIFAYPQYSKINNADSLSSGGPTQSKNTYSERGIIDLAKHNADEKRYETLNRKEYSNDTNKSYNIVHETVKLDHKISAITVLSNKQKYFSSDFYIFPLSVLLASGSVQNDNDPIRNWVSKFISEDTTYYPYKASIVLDTISNSFIGDRVLRWEFAAKIFSKEYSWKQKIFGSGFNFLNWYGFYFFKDKTRSDYPHNPFLSVLLYSGILGLILYMIFIYKVFYYYFKYFIEYKILSVFFIITFFFSFFSAGSPFDPPMMGFFVILPFFIHNIHRKNKPELN